MTSRRDLDEAVWALCDAIRQGDASAVDYWQHRLQQLETASRTF